MNVKIEKRIIEKIIRKKRELIKYIHYSFLLLNFIFGV